MTRLITCFVLVLALCAPSFGQALADKVPADAIVYIGWAGTSDLGPNYKGSHLESILSQSNIPALFSDLYPRLTNFARVKDADAGEIMRTISAVTGPMWRHPCAIYFAGLNPDSTPKIAILCDAGTEAPALQHELMQSLAKLGEGPVKIDTLNSNGIVGVCTGIPADAAISATGLSTTENFQSAMKQLTPHPLITMYLDMNRAVSLADQLIGQQSDADIKANWIKARDAAGLNSVHSFAATCGFDGKDWETRTFVDAPEPRKGLALALSSPTPLSQDLFKAIPQSAQTMSACQCDLAAAITSLRDLIGEVNPDAQQMVDKVLGGAQMLVGKNVVKDILQPLGTEWAVYSAPEIGGGGGMGMVIVNKLRDPAKAKSSLPALSIAISNLATTAVREENLVISTRTTKFGDVSVTYLATPLISPAWAIKDGYLYLGFFPQPVASAAQFTSSHGPSILENPKYTALLERLGNKTPSSVTYDDLPQLAGPGYQAILMYSRLGLGFSDLAGVPSPEPVIPPFSVLLANLTPCGSIGWTDAAGIHSRELTPFPTAELLGGGDNAGLAAVGSSAMGVSILLPSLNRAPETANRVKCASNERQIGQAILLYANENQGKYPPDLGTLVVKEDITAEVFQCPSHDGPPAPPFANKDNSAAWVNDHSDYVYVGSKMTVNAGAEEITVYERPGNHGPDGINILFNDGHVEFVTMAMAKKLITDQNKVAPGVEFPSRPGEIQPPQMIAPPPGGGM